MSRTKRTFRGTVADRSEEQITSKYLDKRYNVASNNAYWLGKDEFYKRKCPKYKYGKRDYMKN